MWQSIGNLIPKSIQKAGIGKSVSDAMVCEEFNVVAQSVIGTAAERCHAVYIKDRTLWVAVLSSAISNELKIYEHDILRALADKFGESKVEKLRFMT